MNIDNPRSCDKVSGQFLFAADLLPADSLRIHILRSPLPHAHIAQIDRAWAQHCPGIVRVITADDIPGAMCWGPLIQDQPALAKGKVRFVGEPVALVVAEPDVTYADATAAVAIEYAALPPVFTPDQALANTAPSLHGASNLLATRHIMHGDVDRAIDAAAIVVQNSYRVGLLDHGYLEAEAGFAGWREGRLTVHYPTQCPHQARDAIAAMLALPASAVRIIPSPVGGGFGGKLEIGPLCHLALAAYWCQRPVALRYTRRESTLYSTKSHPIAMTYTTGATAEGMLTAARVVFTLDTGAYASYGPGVLTRTAIHALGPYTVPTFDILGKLVYTNNPVAGAMRGFGVPQIAFAYERQMELIAKALGIDSFDLRLRNAFETGSRTVTGQILDFEVGLKTCLRKAQAVRAALQQKDSCAQETAPTGYGAAAFFYGIGSTGHHNPATVALELGMQGQIHVHASAIDMGQNSSHMLAEIVARTLNLPHACISVPPIDTFTTPDSGVTSASRTVFYVGNAARAAAIQFLDVLLTAAAELTGREQVALAPLTPLLVDAATGRPVLTLAELANLAYRRGQTITAAATFDPDVTALEADTGIGNPYPTYSFGCNLAQVHVDPATQQTKVTRICAVHDSGAIIDVDTATGQVEGGIGMGVGMALLETCVVEDGTVVTASASQYLLPSVADMPDIDVYFVQTTDPLGPNGAKGLAEPAVIPVAAAIANAVADATGVCVLSLPITPHALWQTRVLDAGTVG